MRTSEEKKGAASESWGSRKRSSESVGSSSMFEVNSGSSGQGAGKRARSGGSLVDVMEGHAQSCADLTVQLGRLYHYKEPGSENFDKVVAEMAEHLFGVVNSASMASKDPNLRCASIDEIKRTAPDALKRLAQLSFSYYSEKDGSIYDDLIKLVFEIRLSSHLVVFPDLTSSAPFDNQLSVEVTGQHHQVPIIPASEEQQQLGASSMEPASHQQLEETTPVALGTSVIGTHGTTSSI